MKKTKALILSYLKYGDFSMIVRAYTQEFGFKNFIIKNAFSRKQKKHHVLLVLNEVEITFYPSKNDSLSLIKDIFQGYIYTSNYTDIIKTSIITFLGEILSQLLKNEETQDISLYNFLTGYLIQLDDKNKYFADFHLYFLLELSRYMGFYPLAKNKNLPYFNLREGVFSEMYKISKIENSGLWNQLLEYDFLNSNNCFNLMQREQMLEEMITYYELHIENFKKPLSLDILKILFKKD